MEDDERPSIDIHECSHDRNRLLVVGRVVMEIYELNPVDGTVKLQFCHVVRDVGYYWAWSDACYIDKNNNIELQQSVNSMFIWYRHSALTVIYLSDVLPSSKSGTLAQWQ
jgi:hypothetical protein